MGIRRVKRGTAAALLAIATVVAGLGGCSTALLDLIAFQALAREEAMLYLGYNVDSKGYGVARLGTTSGALEILRSTVSPENVNGCALCLGYEPISAEFPWPWLYYSAESPNRVMRTQYNAVAAPTEVLPTGVTDQTNCIRVVRDTLGYPIYYWSTPYTPPVKNSKIQYTFSFDMDPVTYRVYYLGLSITNPYESGFGVIGVNAGGSGEVALVTIGHAVESNLLLQNGYLYYVTQDPSALCRIKADGSEASPTVLRTPTRIPSAIAVDPRDETLYWVEYSADAPRRIMKAAAGATSGTLLLDNVPEIDSNGFMFYYRP